MIRIFLLIAMCALTGCATTGGYEQALTSWVGSNINEVINSKHWGYPSSSFIAPDGNKVYVFEQGFSMGIPEQTTINTYNTNPYVTTSYATTTGGGTATFWCKTYFEVDKDGNILSWRYEGNNCTGYSYGMDPYDWVGKIPTNESIATSKMKNEKEAKENDYVASACKDKKGQDVSFCATIARNEYETKMSK